MLVIAKSLRELRFGELMEVYSDSIGEAASDWPDLPRGLALQLAEQDMYQYLKTVFFTTPGALYAIWEEKGKYVSAVRLEPYKDGVLLEALETLPSRRKKGFAHALISSVQDYLARESVVKVYSHVNLRNIPSLSTHSKCGFRVITDHAVYINGSVDYRCCTMCYEG